jgi:hypothetical protein
MSTAKNIFPTHPSSGTDMKDDAWSHPQAKLEPEHQHNSTKHSYKQTAI